MLYKSKTLSGHSMHSRDGVIGKVKEFYFDDQLWAIRYLVADTGSWLTGRQVLISPYALGTVNGDKQEITIDLTMKQIEDSPSVETDKPVSRQFEESYYAILWMADVLVGHLHVGSLSLYCSQPREGQGRKTRVEKNGMGTCGVLPP